MTQATDVLLEQKFLNQRVLHEFPWAIRSKYLVGRDPDPKNILVFFNERRILEVVAFQPGRRGWVISLLPDGADGKVLWPQEGHVTTRRIT